MAYPVRPVACMWRTTFSGWCQHLDQGPRLTWDGSRSWIHCSHRVGSCGYLNRLVQCSVEQHYTVSSGSSIHHPQQCVQQLDSGGLRKLGSTCIDGHTHMAESYDWILPLAKLRSNDVGRFFGWYEFFFFFASCE